MSNKVPSSPPAPITSPMVKDNAGCVATPFPAGWLPCKWHHGHVAMDNRFHRLLPRVQLFWWSLTSSEPLCSIGGTRRRRFPFDELLTKCLLMKGSSTFPSSTLHLRWLIAALFALRLLFSLYFQFVQLDLSISSWLWIYRSAPSRLSLANSY